MGHEPRLGAPMGPTSGVHQEWMAQINVASIARGERYRAFIEVRKRGYYVFEMRATLAHGLQEGRNIYVRPNVNPGRRVFRPDIGEQEEHKQRTVTRPQIHPPLSANIKTPVNVPSGVPRITQAWEANYE